MKNCLIYLSILFFVCSCATSGRMNKKEEASIKNMTEIPASLSTSNQFRLFWYDVKEKTNNFMMDGFIPDDNLIKNYNLRLQDNQYLFSGFITITNDFDYEKFRKLGGHLVNFSQEIKSFSFPLKNITEFVQLTGIQRIELSISTHKTNFDEN